MRDLDLTTLRLFIATCQLGSISKAAEKECFVVSAVSKRISQLEADLGVPLLDRKTQGVTPTPAGVALFERGKDLLERSAQLLREIEYLTRPSRVRIELMAAISTVAEHLPDDIAHFMAQPEHSHISVNVSEGLNSEIAEQVRIGRAELGVIWDKVNLEGLQYRDYRRDHLAVIAALDHPIAQHDSCTFSEAMRFDRVTLQSSSAINTLIVTKSYENPEGAATVTNVATFQAALRMVQAKLAISIMPTEVATPYVSSHRIRIVQLEEDWAQRQFVICYRDERRLTPAADRLVRHLHSRANIA